MSPKTNLSLYIYKLFLYKIYLFFIHIIFIIYLFNTYYIMSPKTNLFISVSLLTLTIASPFSLFLPHQCWSHFISDGKIPPPDPTFVEVLFILKKERDTQDPTLPLLIWMMKPLAIESSIKNLYT
jgi:hypothetical protein